MLCWNASFTACCSALRDRRVAPPLRMRIRLSSEIFSVSTSIAADPTPSISASPPEYPFAT